MANRSIDPYSPGRPPIAKSAVLGIIFVAVAWAVADIAGGGVWILSLVVFAGLIAAVLVGWVNYRNWQTRTELPALLRKNMAPLVRVELPPGTLTTAGHSFGTWRSPGAPKRVTIKAHGLPPMEGETAKKVIAMASSLCGVQLAYDAKKSTPGKRIVLKPKKLKENLTPRQQIEHRILEGAQDVFPKDKPKVECHWDQEKNDEDYLLSVTITNLSGIELALPGKRRQALVKLNTRLPGRFVPDVDASKDQIIFSRSKPLPEYVVPPKEHAPLLADHEAYKDFVVPLGVGDEGVQATWRPKKDAHLLIIGGTGGGKTICEHGVIQRFTQAGWRTWLVDGKRIEFIGYRGWANVELLAQTVDHQIRVLKLAHETMEARYDLIQEGKVRVEDLDPIAIVVDELASLLMAVKRRYIETKEKGMPAAPPVLDWVADIARLGRTAKMHLVLGLQRPDANIMGGEMRDNFGGRISLGKLQSKEASMMMWDDPAIGVAVPNINGRAVAALPGGRLGMVQGTYSANPDPNHDDYHQGMVEAMRPKVAAYTRKTIAPIVPNVETEDGQITWTEIIEADIRDENGRTVYFDPVSSEESKNLRKNTTPEPTTEANLHLQTAVSFQDARELFRYDPLDNIEFGTNLAIKLSELAEQIQPKEESVERKRTTHEDETPSFKSIPVGRNVMISEVQEGQSVILEELGGEELIVASYEVDPDDPTIAYIDGYTADGDYVKREVSSTATVEVFELETA